VVWEGRAGDRSPYPDCHAEHVRQLRVKVPSQLMEVKGSEAQGRHREAGSEGSVEQRHGPMNKNRMMRPTVPGELASDTRSLSSLSPVKTKV